MRADFAVVSLAKHMKILFENSDANAANNAKSGAALISSLAWNIGHLIYAIKKNKSSWRLIAHAQMDSITDKILKAADTTDQEQHFEFQLLFNYNRTMEKRLENQF